MTTILSATLQAAADSQGGDLNMEQIGGTAGLVAIGTVLVREFINWKKTGQQMTNDASRAERDRIGGLAEQLLAAALKSQEATGATLANIDRQMATQTELLRQVVAQTKGGA